VTHSGTVGGCDAHYQRRALSEDAIEKRHKPPDVIIAVVGGLCLIARHVPGRVKPLQLLTDIGGSSSHHDLAAGIDASSAI